MEINSIAQKNVPIENQTATQEKQTLGTHPSTSHLSTEQQDTVVLTEELQEIQAIQNELVSLPEVDAERVANIKHQIAHGEYTVNVDNVARKLIDFESQLFK